MEPPPDPSRADRYSALGDALWHNPDLRFPNLDKVLPLPPAQLPKWDGDPKKLIDAAKALVGAPVVKPTPGAQRTGRANIPAGYLLPAVPVPPRIETAGGGMVMPQYDATAARFTGYWLPQLLEERDARHSQWNRAQVPQRYAQGESFEAGRGGLSQYDGRLMWHYLGVPERRPVPPVNPRVAQGIARITRIPEPRQACNGDTECPQTGVWFASLREDHPQARVYNRWDRQAYVAQGQQFPDPRTLHLNLAAREVRWLWLDNANVPGFAGFPDVTLSDMHDAEGSPKA